SQVTVHRVLLHEGRDVSPATAERIRAVATELGYHPETNQFARKMRSRRHQRPVLNHAVALLNQQGGEVGLYFMLRHFGITEVLNSTGFDLVLNWAQPTTPWQLPHTLLRGDIDGVLFSADERLIPEVLQQLRALSGFGDRPVVVYQMVVPGCSTVCADDFTGGYLLADHLLKLGHRRMLYFIVDSQPQSLRSAGYRNACQAHDVDPDEVLVSAQFSYLPWRSHSIAHHVALREAFTRHPDITAILAMNDASVPYIWTWLDEQGLRVPDDISLTGFDDVKRVIDERYESLLTTVHVPLHEIGRQAATLLVDLITGKVTEETHLTLPVNLVIRQSTAPPRTPPLLHRPRGDS
ncbi:MAG TPA: LacI family DNA-binding transcriptional regulator, partial [Armatimonadota bacterium]